MREKIKEIINDAKELDQNLDHVNNLISGGYLDSLETLMLINALELEFDVKFSFNDDIFKNLESVDKIENMLKLKKNMCDALD